MTSQAYLDVDVGPEGRHRDESDTLWLTDRSTNPAHS